MVRADRGAGAGRGTSRSRSRSSHGARSGRAITVDRPDGLTKLVLEPKTGRVLGVGIAGSGAGELIAEGVLAIEMGATAEDLQADDPSASDAVGNA